MTSVEFNKLEYFNKILLINNYGVEIDNIFPWTGNLRIVTLYKLFDFIIELECNLTKANSKITSINGYDSYECLLDRYPHHFDKFKREIIYNLLG